MKTTMNRFFVLLGLMLSLNGIAQWNPIESQSSDPNNPWIIPFEKFQLPNGLTILLHPDKSDPMVHVDVTYHVGSAREMPGRSGFAHFFEHMMFQGSDNVADEEHFKIVTEAGGTLNGTTNLDRTNYFETLPSNQLETALWLEADRMGFFLDAVTLKKFEIQRATVKNERGQRYDNRPYGLVYEKTMEALYPFGHPYSWTTIGYIEDLNAATLDDLKRFFLRWYGPNNATLTVAGDFDREQCLTWIKKYFGSIPRGPEVKSMPAKPVKLESDRFVSYKDKVRFPLLSIAYPTVESRHEDEAALDILADLIGSGKSSILYQQLEKTQKAKSAYSYHSTAELSGYFSVSITGFPNASLPNLKTEWEKALLAFEKRGVSLEDIERFANQQEAEAIQGLASISGKAAQLAYYQTFTGSPKNRLTEIARYRQVRPEQVMEVYKKYLKGKAAVYLSCLPKEGEILPASKDNSGRPQSPEGYKPDLSEYANLTYQKGKDNFDRSKKPEAAAEIGDIQLKIWKQTLASGALAVGTSYPELPLVSVQISWPIGYWNEPLQTAGVGQLMVNLLEEKSISSSAEALNDRLKSLGASVSFYTSSLETGISIRCLKKDLTEVMQIVEERLLKPAFDAEDLERLRKQQIENLKNRKTNAGALASDMVNATLMEGHRAALAEAGSIKSSTSITRKDILDWYDKVFQPSQTQIAAVGFSNAQELEDELGFLNKLKRQPQENKSSMPELKFPMRPTLVVVDKPGSAQSEIRWVSPGMPFSALGPYFMSTVSVFPFSGAFNSRLNLNLREDKGYTYGVRGAYQSNKHLGYYQISGSFLHGTTDSTLLEITRELKQYLSEGPTDSELEFTKLAMAQRDALNYETPWQRQSILKNILTYQAMEDYPTKQKNMLKSMNLEQMNFHLKRYLDAQSVWVIVVADYSQIKSKLEALDMPIILKKAEE
jgi:zinc protease